MHSIVNYNISGVSHIYNTRSQQAGDLSVFLPQGVHMNNKNLQAISIAGARCFNCIPNDIRNSISLSIFKRQLRDYIFNSVIDVYSIVFPHRA